MWECPDFFELEGQGFLLACPQGVPAEEYRYQNVYQCGYFPAELDFENRNYQLGEFRELDRGFDFYAAQSFEDGKGRRILLGWMGMPDADYDNDVTVKQGWIHAMAMPRELRVRDGRLIQKPLEEMKGLRKSEWRGSIREFGIWKTETCCFEMRADLGEHGASMTLRLREDVFLSYEGQILTLSLGKSGCGRGRRSIRLEELRNFTVFSDTSSLEIFVNDGEEVITARVYSKEWSQSLGFEGTEPAGTVVFYELGGFTVV